MEQRDRPEGTVFVIVCASRVGPPWVMLELPEIGPKPADLEEVTDIVMKALQAAGYAVQDATPRST